MSLVMKRAAEAALSPVAALLTRRRFGSRETLILAYHNIVPYGREIVGETSLHLPQHQFAAQLRLLSATHEVVPLDAVRDRPQGRRPRAVITFDDGYRGALTAGIEELDRQKLPATFFIPPAFIPGRSFWWDEAAAECGEVESTRRAHAIEVCAGRDAGIRAALAMTAPTMALPAHARAIDEAGLHAAAALPGITFGAHTWGHVNLARVPDDEVMREVIECSRWLEDRFANTVKWLSFPYGRSAARCEQIVAECGYHGALRIDGGWVRSDQRAAFVLPRLNVPGGLSIRGFRLRTAGLLAS